jgi:hypothetical protein
VGPHPAIDMEVLELPAEHFGSFVDGIPAPLGIGKVKLADGTWVSGFVCEAVGVEGGPRSPRWGIGGGGWRSALEVREVERIQGSRMRGSKAKQPCVLADS